MKRNCPKVSIFRKTLREKVCEGGICGKVKAMGL